MLLSRVVARLLGPRLSSVSPQRPLLRFPALPYSTMSAPAFTVTAIPCLEDNYAYLLLDIATGEAAVVDPVDPAAVAAAAAAANVPLARISTVLTTHKHWDHSGGNLEMVKLLNNARSIGSASSAANTATATAGAESASGSANDDASAVRVVGGVLDAVPGATMSVSHGDTVTVGALTVSCIHTPCHTKGHICYWVRPAAAVAHNSSEADSAASGVSAEDAAGAVFSGDTLFVGGCGRLFEGSAAQMRANLTSPSLLGALPDGTRVYTGHEYTRSNLLFCRDAAADALAGATASGEGVPEAKDALAAIEAKLSWVAAGGHDGAKLTQPSTMGQERATNVFMRAKSDEEFARLRTWKDSWKPSAAKV